MLSEIFTSPVSLNSTCRAAYWMVYEERNASLVNVFPDTTSFAFGLVTVAYINLCAILLVNTLFVIVASENPDT